MKDDIKPNKCSIAPKDTSIELLKYQMASAKKEARKNMVILGLVVAIIAFAAGYIVSDIDRGEVNALQSANSALRIENERLKASAPSENQ